MNPTFIPSCRPQPGVGWCGRLRALFAAALLLLAAGRAIAAPEGSPWGADYFPNVTLWNQDGKAVRFYDDLIKDKVVEINFIYVGCTDSCSLETAKLRQVQEALGDRVGRDVFMVSISIDPANDTPAVLKAYMETFRVGPGWQFLTGKPEDITLLRKKLGLYRDEARNDHAASLVVGNESTGQWVKRSAFDHPKVLAAVLGDQLFNYRTAKTGRASYAAAPKIGRIDPGEDLYRRRCQVCHTIGAGDAVGPDLSGVVVRRDHDWLVRWLKAPDEMLAARDPIALALLARYKGLPMPNLRLGDSDAEALIAYLAKAKPPAAAALAAAPASPAAP